MSCAHCGEPLASDLQATARFCSGLCRSRHSNAERHAAMHAVRAIRRALGRPDVTVADIAALLP